MIQQQEFQWVTGSELVTRLCFWAVLNYELSRRCTHGHWDPQLGGFCWYCDTGMST